MSTGHKPNYLKKNYGHIIILCLSFILLSIFIYHNYQKYPDTFLNKDEYYHASLIKNVAETNDIAFYQAKYWGLVSYNYPPAFPLLHAFIFRSLKLTDFVQYAKIATLVTLIMFLVVFVWVVWLLLRSAKSISLATLFLVSSYFPMNRLMLFLPENLALIFLFLFIVVLIKLKNHDWVRLPLLGLLVLGTLFTNVLTATFLFATIALLVPISLYRNRISEAFKIAIVGGFIYIFSQQIQFLDTFWTRYLHLVSFVALILCALILLEHFLIRKFRLDVKQQYLINVTFVIIIITGSLYDWFNERFVWGSILTERYYILDNLPKIINNAFHFFFLNNGGTHVGLQSTLFYLGIGGIVISVYRSYRGRVINTPIIILTFLSFSSLMFGPYIGIEPGSENPRAMLYFSLMVTILSATFLSASYFRKHSPKYFIPLLVSLLLVTTVNNTMNYINYNSTDNIPKPIVKFINQEVSVNNKILVNSQYVMELYSRTIGESATYVLDNKYLAENNTDLVKTQLKKQNITFILTGPNSVAEQELFGIASYPPSISNGAYSIYRIRTQ